MIDSWSGDVVQVKPNGDGLLVLGELTLDGTLIVAQPIRVVEILIV